MDKLRITPVQCALHWEDQRANIERFDRLLRGLDGKTDVIVLPEMFTSGFTMRPAAVAEQMEGPSMKWMHTQALATAAVITGSLVIEENGVYRNRLIWMRPDGSYDYYDKRHGFSPAGEHTIYERGQRRLITTWHGWRVCPMVCYDLRFPAWSRNLNAAYDLLIYTANWPTARAAHWRTLLRARAIENQAYCVGVNRIGTDDNGLHYRGDSQVIDMAGEVRWAAAVDEAVKTVTLDAGALRDYRKKLAFLADATPFNFEGIATL